jgi:hypothetical protein
MSFDEKTNWIKELYYNILYNKCRIEDLTVIVINDCTTDIGLRVVWIPNKTTNVKVYLVQEWVDEAQQFT